MSMELAVISIASITRPKEIFCSSLRRYRRFHGKRGYPGLCLAAATAHPAVFSPSCRRNAPL